MNYLFKTSGPPGSFWFPPKTFNHYKTHFSDLDLSILQTKDVCGLLLQKHISKGYLDHDLSAKELRMVEFIEVWAT